MPDPRFDASRHGIAADLAGAKLDFRQKGARKGGHQRRDVTLRENRSPTRSGAGPRPLAILGNTPLDVVRDVAEFLTEIREIFPESRRDAVAAAQGGSCRLLLGHTKLESTVRFGIEVDDAFASSERTDLRSGPRRPSAAAGDRRGAWKAELS